MPDHGCPSEERFRLFVAIELPDTVKAEIANAQDCLRDGLPPNSARWTRPDQFHLTLQFLGNVPAASTPQLIDSLRAACQAIPPMKLRASGIGFFPSHKSPRVVWVGVRDNQDQLPVLHAAVQEGSSRFTEEKSEERFSGHITLGRLKDLRRPETNVLTKAAEKFSATSFGEWTTREVQLMRSRLSSGGAEHSKLATIPLGG